MRVEGKREDGGGVVQEIFLFFIWLLVWVGIENTMVPIEAPKKKKKEEITIVVQVSRYWNWRETRIFSFSIVHIAGKTSISSFSAIHISGKPTYLAFPMYMLVENPYIQICSSKYWRKTLFFDFPWLRSSAKLAYSGFPLFSLPENLSTLVKLPRNLP